MISNAEDVVGHSFTELFPYEDADVLLQGHRDFFAKGLIILYKIFHLTLRRCGSAQNLRMGQGLLLMLWEIRFSASAVITGPKLLCVIQMNLLSLLTSKDLFRILAKGLNA